jgi:hypothetical protein
MKLKKYQLAAIISFLAVTTLPFVNFLTREEGSINYGLIFPMYFCTIASILIGSINTYEISKKDFSLCQKIFWIIISQAALILISIFYLIKAIA